MSGIRDCILYRNFEEFEILEGMTALMDGYASGETIEKAELFQCMNGLVEMAATYGFSGNLWHNYLTYLLVNHENAFSKACEIRGAVEGSINELAMHDFSIFKSLYDFDLKKFDEILSTLKMAAEEKEIRLNIKAADFRTYGNKVITALEEFAVNNKDCVIADDNREGIRITTPYGWMLLRLSVHDPVMPINFESDEIGGTDKNVEFFRAFYEQFEQLDLSSYN